MIKEIIKDAILKLFVSVFFSAIVFLILVSNDILQQNKHLKLDFFMHYDWKSASNSYFYIVVIVFLIVFVSNLLIDYINYRKKYLLNVLNLSSISANKSLMNITENISHELSTPLEVITFKMYKIMNFIDLMIKDIQRRVECPDPDKNPCLRRLYDIREDFTYVESSIEQISNILNKMKGFKSIKYSNGNKTLYDVIETAFKIMTISHKDFKWNIDVKFKEYNLDCKNCISNADFLNILINHIKNSLEANSTLIEAKFIRYSDPYVYMFISDNGTGIPKEFIPKIFIPNISTKTKVLDIRGNGLYINLSILKTSGGNIRLIKTNNQGTIFELKVKANKIK